MDNFKGIPHYKGELKLWKTSQETPSDNNSKEINAMFNNKENFLLSIPIHNLQTTQ